MTRLIIMTFFGEPRRMESDGRTTTRTSRRR